MEERTVRLVDDLDGESEAAETIEWSVDRIDYTIDLSEVNAATLRAVLAPYIAAARLASGVVPKRRQAPSGARRDLSAVRTWLQSAGYAIGDRGRISADLMEA